MSKPVFELLTEENVPEALADLLPNKKGDLFIASGTPPNKAKLEQRIIDWCKDTMDGKIAAFSAKVLIDKEFATAITVLSVESMGDAVWPNGKEPIAVPVFRYSTGYGIIIFMVVPMD